MGRFQRIYESLLLEMPHLVLDLDGEHFDFDFELEKHTKDWYGLLRMIHNVLASSAIKDQYGNVLKLKNLKQKLEFVEQLRNNDFFNLFLKKYYNKTFEDLIDIGAENPKLNVVHGNHTSPAGVNMSKDFTPNVRGSEDISSSGGA